MYNIKDLLTKVTREDDHDKIEILADMLESLIEESGNKGEYEHSLHMLMYGPHFNDCKLRESGIKMKYSVDEISRHVSAQGIVFDSSVTIEDITYVANSLYSMYYPLISDIAQTLKFSEKYIKDDTYPIRYGRAYMEWCYKEKLRKKFKK